MLYDDAYAESEYYAAAEYRREEMADVCRTTPILLLGDRPYRVSDLRWWEGLSVVGRLSTFLAWPFLLPFRPRLWGYESLINKRDTFMTHELHKGSAYYINENSKVVEEAGTSIRGALMCSSGHLCTVIGHSCPID